MQHTIIATTFIGSIDYYYKPSCRLRKNSSGTSLYGMHTHPNAMLELSRLIVSPHSPAFRKYCLALGLQPFLFLISARSTDSSTCAMFFCDSMSSSPVTLTAIPSICPSSVWYVVAGLTTQCYCFS